MPFLPPPSRRNSPLILKAAWPAVFLVLTLLITRQQAAGGRAMSPAVSTPMSVFESAPAAVRCDWSGQSYVDFYNPPPLGTVTPDRLGEILRLEHIQTFTEAEVANAAGLPTSPYGAEAYRILYLSQDPSGTPEAVSGLIVAPTGPAPAGGFPVVAHGHGTTGMADQCAPSRRNLTLYDLLPWVAEGYLVTATDYAGLGVPGLHPYGIGLSAANSMLDSARAALNFCDAGRGQNQPAANQVFLEGHSQGGHSALFAQERWPAYAPSLNVLGTVTFAPGAELRFLAQKTAAETLSARIAPLSLAMYAYSNYYGSPPTLQPWLLEPYATELPARADNQCLTSLSLWLGFQPDTVFQPAMLTDIRQGNWNALQPWTAYIDANTPGNFSSPAPVLILQGELDALVPSEASQRLTQRLCANNTRVKLNRYGGLGHSTIVWRTRFDAMAWMDDRLANVPVQDDCGGGVIPALARDLEPVIIKGSEVPFFAGLQTADLRLFGFQGSSWQPIDFQVDEVTGLGDYVLLEDGLLDANDEIVFMARDLGQQAPSAPPVDQALPIPISNTWYELEITDPVNQAQQGFAYLVHAPAALPAAPADIVTFDPLTRRVQGETYALGFPPFRPGIEYLALGGSGIDILDRTKFFLDCSVPFICPITENKLKPYANQSYVKDGPVRAILHEGQVMAYATMLSWTRPFTIPTNLPGDVRVSTDFSPAATGATYFNAVVPQGITIDGVPNSVLPAPASDWWQVSTPDGSLVQVMDVAEIGGTPTNYFVDSSVPDPADTGDQLHYGDSGITVSNPNPQPELRFTWYLLPDLQPNVGAAYAAFYKQPLTTRAVLQFSAAAEYDYLPAVFR